MEAETDPKKAEKPPRFRSPTYPFIALPKALDRAKALFGTAGRGEVNFEGLASAFGYGPRSSGLLQTASALGQFGLLVTVATGKARKFRLTREALSLIEEPDVGPADTRAAVQRIALRPKVFAELASQFSGKRITDADLIRYLTRERAEAGVRPFTDQGAKDAVSKFKESMGFAGLELGDFTASDGDKTTGHNQVALSEPSSGLPAAQTDPSRLTPRSIETVITEGRIFQEGILGPDTIYCIIVRGKLGPKEIDHLITKLEFDKLILADNERSKDDEREGA